MKKRLILILGAVIFLFLILAGCTTAGAELGLVGTWKGTASSSSRGTITIKMTFNYNDSGKFEASWSAGSYSDSFSVIKSDSVLKTIVIQYNTYYGAGKTSVTYDYLLLGNKLTIKNLWNGANSQDTDFTKQ